MLIEAPQMEIGNVIVTTTADGGHDPVFWAQSAADRIVSVGSVIAEFERQGHKDMADIIRSL
jgi:hypothetical protein